MLCKQGRTGPGVAQGDGDGVGGVIGLGHGLQMQQPPGHVLDLMLGGVAIAHHGLLDLHGLILKNRHPGLPDGQKNNAPALGHVDAGGDVMSEKQLLNGHGFRLGGLEQLGHVVVDHFQPPGEIRIGRGGDGAAVEQPVLPPLGVDKAEARDAVTGVDSQNPHYRPPLAMLMT